MRTAALVAFAALMVAACSRGEDAAKTDSPVAAPPAAAPAALSLADLVGKWSQETRGENSDSVLVKSEVNATADPAGWTITLPGRPPMPMKVTVSGDSLMTSTGPYESVLRKGVQVTTESVSRLKDGKIVGITTAHYKTTGADSVVKLRTEMTRVP
jgi:hypothetical protein